MNVMGFIATGGKSSRMGQDKAWVELGGQPMISRVLAIVETVTGPAALLGNHSSYQKLDRPVFSDENAGVGPLEAIRTALNNSQGRPALIVACDLPFVSAELLKLIIEELDGFTAVVPCDSSELIQPLCAVYSTDALAEVTKAIRSGKRKVSELLDAISVRSIAFSEISHLRGSSNFFHNVNSPEDLAQARAWFEQSGSIR